MKKLLIKIMCGALFMICFLTGCNCSTKETSQEPQTSIVTAEDKVAAKPIVPDKEILLSMPPIFDPFLKEESDVSKTKETSKAEEPSVEEESFFEEVAESENSSITIEEVYEDMTYCEPLAEDGGYIVDEYAENELSYEPSYDYGYEEEYESFCDCEEEEYESSYDYDYEEEYESFYDYEEEGYEEEYTDYSNAIYTPADFQDIGIISWGSWSWTFYSQRAMPGEDLIIPGRYVDYNGYVCDENDYICLASSSLDKGTVVDTPFGKMGKVYDCGCLSYILDVYVDW